MSASTNKQFVTKTNLRRWHQRESGLGVTFGIGFKVLVVVEVRRPIEVDAYAQESGRLLGDLGIDSGCALPISDRQCFANLRNNGAL